MKNKKSMKVSVGTSSVLKYCILFIYQMYKDSVNPYNPRMVMEFIQRGFYIFIGNVLYYYTHIKEQVLDTLFKSEIIESDNKYRYKITNIYVSSNSSPNIMKKLSIEGLVLHNKTNLNDELTIPFDVFYNYDKIYIYYDLIENTTGDYSSYIFIHEFNKSADQNQYDNHDGLNYLLDIFPPHSDDLLQERHNTPKHKKHTIMSSQLIHDRSNGNDTNDTNDKLAVCVKDLVRMVAGPLHDFYSDAHGSCYHEDLVRLKKTSSISDILTFDKKLEYKLVIYDNKFNNHFFNKGDKLQFINLSFDMEIVDMSKLLKLDLSKLPRLNSQDITQSSNSVSSNTSEGQVSEGEVITEGNVEDEDNVEGNAEAEGDGDVDSNMSDKHMESIVEQILSES